MNNPIQLVGTSKGQTTGLSRYSQNLYQALRKIGANVELVGIKPPIPTLVNRLAKSIGFDLQTFFTTYPLTLPAASKGKLVHLTSQNQASALTCSNDARSSRPVIITVHDLITLAYHEQPELTGYMTPYEKWFEHLTRRGLEKATFLIAISLQTRHDIMRFLNYPSERIGVIYQGIDQAIFQPREVPDAFYQQYNLKKKARYLLYVGSDAPRKNLRRLIEAFALVSAHNPDLKLLKVGGASFVAQREQLQALIQRCGLEGKVLFFEQVPEQALPSFYNVADLFVFPSLYEGFGLPPLEAMACGTPVVTSNQSSLPEVVGDAAIQVAPYDVQAIADGMMRVLSDKALAASLRQKGLVRANFFSWERTARETLAVYERVRESKIQ